MPTPQSLTLLAQTESLGTVTHFVRQKAIEAGLSESRLDELDLLVEEIFMNIARHAYPKNSQGLASITCSIPRPGELAVEFADQGVEFDPLAAAPPDLTLDLSERPVGGLGVFLLREFSNSLNYRREHGWNFLTFGISSKR